MNLLRRLPLFVRVSPLIVLALAAGLAMIPVGSSSPRAVAHLVSVVQNCGSPIVPTSPQTRTIDLEQVANKRLRDGTELAHQQWLLSRIQRHQLPVHHKSIQRVKQTIGQLKQKLMCLSNEVAATLSIAVSGNRLVNGSGKVVTLHGVDISGTEWQCLYGNAFYGPSNEESIEAIAAWHVNAVRIPLNEDCWLGINGAPTDIEAYHEEIRNYVNRLHAHGMYAILDLHWSAPGATLSHLGARFAGFYEMADESHAPALWESIASYFKNDHAVLFDLFNEPHGISWNCWLNGCAAPRGFETAGMQQLVDVVRATGATQPIMVGGLEHASLAGTEWLDNHPDDPANQLVASVHVYAQANTSRFNSNIGIVAAQFPVVMGEIGETNCADNDLDVLLPWADTHGVSYLAWAWYTGNCDSYPSLIKNYNGTPTNYGIGYREYLLANFPAPSP